MIQQREKVLGDFLQINDAPSRPHPTHTAASPPSTIQPNKTQPHHQHNKHNPHERPVHPVFTAVSTQTRGKEREEPKKKKLSVTKKIILQERKEKQSQITQDQDNSSLTLNSGLQSLDLLEKDDTKSPPEGNKPKFQYNQYSNQFNSPQLRLAHFLPPPPPQDSAPSFSVPLTLSTYQTNTSQQVSPHHLPSSPSPLQSHNFSSFQTTTTSPLRLPHFLPTAASNSPHTHPNPQPPSTEPTQPQLSTQHTPKPLPHYISYYPTPEIDKLAFDFIAKLHQFEVNKKKTLNNPLKFKKRLVAGLKEVKKKLSVHKLKCVIVAPNIEEIKTEGGLDDQVEEIVKMSKEQEITLVFALSRKKLGAAMGMNYRQSVVGVIYYDGAEDAYRKLAEAVATVPVLPSSDVSA